MLKSSCKRHRFMIVFVILVSLVIQGDWLWESSSSESAQSPISSKRDDLSRNKIPLPVQYTFSSDLGKKDPDYHFRADGQSSYTNFNPRTGITTSINSTSMQVRAGVGSWSNSLVDWGRGSTSEGQHPLALPSLLPHGRGRIAVGKYPFVSTANRLECHMPGLTAWYVNGPLGLQQGWTVSKAPSRAKGEQLTLILALGGSLRTLVESGGRSLVLLDSMGLEILRYGGLMAYDATGRELEAEFVLDAGRLLVQVDDAEAVYPLTIDPWVQLAKLTTGNGSLGDYLSVGGAMSSDGSTVVLGAVYDGGVGVDKGALFVYEPFEGIWIGDVLYYDAKLTVSGGASDDNLGFLIAIDDGGNTIVAGVPNHDEEQANTGAVFVFARTPGTPWKDATQTAKLLEMIPWTNLQMGSSVAISGNGEWVAAGEPEFDATFQNVGRVFIFKRPAGGWTGTVKPINDLLNLNHHTGDRYGSSVALSGDGLTLVVGMPQNGSGGDGLGKLYVNQPVGGDWTSNTYQTSVLYDLNAQNGDFLGKVVTISEDGNTIAAGMWDLDDPGTNRGAVYVYVKESSGWGPTGTMTAVLSAFDGADGDCLGWSVAISSGGETIAAGAPNNDTGGTDRGVVLIYERPTVGGWQNTSFYNAKLTNNETSVIKGLGWSLGISSNGDSLLAGAPNVEGRAYVYLRSGAGWSSTGDYEVKLIHADGRSDDYLGFSAAVSNSYWQTLALGAPQYDYNASNQGAVFLFMPGVPWWAYPKVLTKLYTADGGADDNLGYSVAISADGYIVAAGAPNRDGVGSNWGAVYVFDGLYGNTPVAKLLASDAGDGDWLGWSVTISGDGNTIIAGAPSRDGSGLDRGAIYVWVKYDPIWSDATETAIITASDSANGDKLGYAVSISYDGSVIAAGAPYQTGTAGAAYIYTRPGGGWTSTSTFAAKKTASDPATDANLGRALALSQDGSTLTAGAYKSEGVNRGAVYVFEKGTAWSIGSEVAKLTSSDSGVEDKLGFSVAVDYDGNTIAAGSVNNASVGIERGAVYVYAKPTLGWMDTTTPTKKLTALDGIDWDHLGYSVAIDDTGCFILSGAPNADVQDWDRGAGYYWWYKFNLYLPVVKK